MRCSRSVSRPPLRTRWIQSGVWVLGLFMVVFGGAPTAQAAPLYLVGAQVFTYSGGTPYQGYQFSTNSGTSAHATLPLDMQGDLLGIVSTTISFELHAGDNIFEWSGNANAPMDSYGLNLFFNATGGSFNPTNEAGSATGLAGDLTATVAAGSGAFSVPSLGTDIAGYNWNNHAYLAHGVPFNLAYPIADANGLTSFLIGDSTVSIAGFNAVSTNSAGPNPRGSFTLHVASVSALPEPPTMLLFGAPLAALWMLRRRRGG
jgi:hypothetical protein